MRVTLSGADPALITARQAADRLGLSHMTVRRHTHGGGLTITINGTSHTIGVARLGPRVLRYVAADIDAITTKGTNQ